MQERERWEMPGNRRRTRREWRTEAGRRDGRLVLLMLRPVEAACSHWRQRLGSCSRRVVASACVARPPGAGPEAEAEAEAEAGPGPGSGSLRRWHRARGRPRSHPSWLRRPLRWWWRWPPPRPPAPSHPAAPAAGTALGVPPRQRSPASRPLAPPPPQDRPRLCPCPVGAPRWRPRRQKARTQPGRRRRRRRGRAAMRPGSPGGGWWPPGAGRPPPHRRCPPPQSRRPPRRPWRPRRPCRPCSQRAPQ